MRAESRGWHGKSVGGSRPRSRWLDSSGSRATGRCFVGFEYEFSVWAFFPPVMSAVVG